MLQEFSPLQQLGQILTEDLSRLDHVIQDVVRSDVELVSKVANHIMKNGGKRIRPVLTIAAFQLALSTLSAQDYTQIFLNLSPDATGVHEVHRLAAAVELIHNATLLHDDVIDLSNMRRGEPAAHTLFGNTAAILVGDYLFSKSFQLMIESKTDGVLQVLSKVAARITEGEVLQLSHNFNVNTDYNHYFEIVESKTAVLFEAASRVGAMVALQGLHPEYVECMQEYGKNLGLAFQILDDIYDYFPTENFGKNPGDDLLEGKVTLPVILLLDSLKRNDDSMRWVLNVFSQERKALKEFSIHDALQKIRELCKAHDIDQKAFMIAQQFVDLAKDALNIFPDTALKKVLQELPDSLIKRS